jgi:hypothetical protein
VKEVLLVTDMEVTGKWALASFQQPRPRNYGIRNGENYKNR